MTKTRMERMARGEIRFSRLLEMYFAEKRMKAAKAKAEKQTAKVAA